LGWILKTEPTHFLSQLAHGLFLSYISFSCVAHFLQPAPSHTGPPAKSPATLVVHTSMPLPAVVPHLSPHYPCAASCQLGFPLSFFSQRHRVKIGILSPKQNKIDSLNEILTKSNPGSNPTPLQDIVHPLCDFGTSSPIKGGPDEPRF
jgi:hypothetical protein